MDHIRHIAHLLSEIADTIKWYKTRFDLKRSYSDNSRALLDFPFILMALVSPDQHPPHIVIDLDITDSFDPLHQHRDGTASTSIKNPWGSTIVEIMRTSHGEIRL